MAKYDPLRQMLARQTGTRIRLTFAQVEDVLAAALPASARLHSAWWANERVGRHVQARAWLGAGWQVEHVDLRQELVTFARA